MKDDKALKALAAAVVAIHTTYEWREAILYGIALGVTLETYKHPESQMLFATMLDILSDNGDGTSIETGSALDALKATADLMGNQLA